MDESQIRAALFDWLGKESEKNGGRKDLTAEHAKGVNTKRFSLCGLCDSFKKTALRPSWLKELSPHGPSLCKIHNGAFDLKDLVHMTMRTDKELHGHKIIFPHHKSDKDKGLNDSLEGAAMETLKWIAYEKRLDSPKAELEKFGCPHCEMNVARSPLTKKRVNARIAMVKYLLLICSDCIRT